MHHFGFPLETILIFFSVVGLSVYLDLFAHRHTKTIGLKDATLWSLFWLALALAFYGYIWLRFDKEFADLYLAGYALEKSLSVDNLMVFMAIFASFGINGHLQHRILYWGIIGALLFRAVFVLIGNGLFLASPWVGFGFAFFVLYSALKMWKASISNVAEDGEQIDYSQHWSVRWIGKVLPVYPQLVGEQFVVKSTEIEPPPQKVRPKAHFYATPALLCLFVIEISDVAFAFDSVPAVIGVTEEPLLVYAAMIFAILGLRSLYFILAALTRYLVHLEKAVIALLFFVGIKMGIQAYNHAIADTGLHLSANASLVVVLGTLTVGVVASFLFPNRAE